MLLLFSLLPLPTTSVADTYCDQTGGCAWRWQWHILSSLSSLLYNEKDTALGRQALIQLGHGFNLCLLLSLQSSSKLSTNSPQLSCHLQSLGLKMMFHVQEPRVPAATFLCSRTKNQFMHHVFRRPAMVLVYSFSTHLRRTQEARVITTINKCSNEPI